MLAKGLQEEGKCAGVTGLAPSAKVLVDEICSTLYTDVMSTY